MRHDRGPSAHKAEQELDYQPVALRAMLEDCHHWMQTEGLLST